MRNRILPTIFITAIALMSSCATSSTVSAEPKSEQEVRSSIDATAEVVACDANDFRACHNLAFSYATGTGVPVDKRRAASLYRKACDGGEGKSCFNLGLVTLNGDGLAKDVDEAIRLFEKACDSGVLNGCTNVGVASVQGLGGSVNLSYAVAMFQKACAGDEADACHSLGVAYMRGDGVARDPQQARASFEKACKLGYAQSCACLAEKPTQITLDERLRLQAANDLACPKEELKLRVLIGTDTGLSVAQSVSGCGREGVYMISKTDDEWGWIKK